MKNIKYNSKTLSDTYSKIRTSWSEFYDSEKTILERVGITKDDSILDLGCGCGGLGVSLQERFGNIDYTGIDINEPSILKSKSINSFGKFYCGDILDSKFNKFIQKFDKVISFSCIDWNIEFLSMLDRSWDFVKPGGYLITSLRLTDKKTLNSINESFQQIDDDFKAQYVVVNSQEILEKFKQFNPREISSYGYWGNVNKSYGNKTVTQYDRVCFSVFSVKKRINENDSIHINLELPI
jgi:SAM-dependent methyltransferase